MAPMYDQLAGALKESGSGVNVGKVDGTQERGLMARFPVSGFPTIFLIREDGSVRQYGGARTAEAMKEWATGGFEKTAELSYTQHPNSVVGRAKGFVISAVYKIKGLHGTTMEVLGLSPLMAAVVLVGGGLLVTFAFSLFAAVLVMQKEKRD